MRYYSKTTGNAYLSTVHGSKMPADAVPITEFLYLSVIANPAGGKIRSHDASGLPILIDPPPYVPNEAELCHQIDNAADAARLSLVVDPVRALEYQLAATEAATFKATGYPASDVPRTVAPWMVGGRSAKQAADSILSEAAQYNEALYVLRETRLAAKARVRQAMADGDVSLAQEITNESTAAIELAVSWVESAAG